MCDLNPIRSLLPFVLIAGLTGLSACSKGPDNTTSQTPDTTATAASDTRTTTSVTKPVATPERPEKPAATLGDRTVANAMPASSAATSGVPVLTFEKELIDFGKIVDTETHHATFPFTNTGDGTLVISQVKAACGCTATRLTRKQFAPGESHQIEIEFDPKGKSGITDKYITIFSNDPTKPEHRVKLTSNIQPMLDYERMYRVGDIPLGEGHRSTFAVHYKDPELTFRNISCNNEWVSGQIVDQGIIDSTEGGETTYRADIELVVPENAPWGLLYATRLTMSVTGRPRPDKEPTDYDYTMYITGNVFGDVKAAPSIISLGTLKPGNPYEKFCELTRTSGEPLEITSLQLNEASMPGVQLRSEQVSPSRQRVYVYGTTQAPGSLKGEVVVTTNVPGEEVLSLRFSGFGRH